MSNAASIKWNELVNRYYPVYGPKTQLENYMIGRDKIFGPNLPTEVSTTVINPITGKAETTIAYDKPYYGKKSIFERYPDFPIPRVNDQYKFSANIVQGLVALVEAMVFLDGKFSTDLLYAGIIFVSTFVPPSGLGGYGYEKQTEIIVATLATSIIMKFMRHGGFLKNAIRGFMLSTSSMGLVNEMYMIYY